MSSVSADEIFKEGRILEVPNLRVFAFSELRSATKNFKLENALGEGGFGMVYKGVVEEKTLNPSKSGTGMVVAVKKLNPESMQGLEEWQVTKIPIANMFFFLDLLNLQFESVTLVLYGTNQSL